MPQGRRKIPFSSKQKKIQLQEKRLRKKIVEHEEADDITEDSLQFVSEKKPAVLNATTVIDKSRDSQRYKLIFKKEDQEELKRNREKAHFPIDVLPEESLEVCYDEFYIQDSIFDIPKRPPWDFSMDRKTLEAREERYFRSYVHSIQSKCTEEDLSYFELNLETWRQLWRVLEMSDIVLLVADIRHPILHFPPALYSHVTEDLKKDIILVLNKIDLVPPSLVLAWKLYFQEHFPLLHLLCFSSFGGMAPSTSKTGRRKGKLRMAAEGAKNLYSTCQKIVNGAVDLFSWKNKIEEELTSAVDNKDDEAEELNALAGASVQLVPSDTGHYSQERYAQGVLTLGFVGHPNVGKSSVLNAIMGKKVVSVSRTPGHTKHFQTIFLTPDVRLCDCPGLVFPSKVPKAMQVLSGCYPIAQLREPFSAVGYLAQRVDLPKYLHLSHPQSDDRGKDSFSWTSYDLCEAWALKRGFLTARAARPDVHRSGNHLLRMALDGKTLCLKFYPSGYTQQKGFFLSHPELPEIRRLQVGSNDSQVVGEEGPTVSSGSSSSEEDDLEGAAGPNKFSLLAEEN